MISTQFYFIWFFYVLCADSRVASVRVLKTLVRVGCRSGNASNHFIFWKPPLCLGLSFSCLALHYKKNHVLW
jgi:hypothetical protein